MRSPVALMFLATTIGLAACGEAEIKPANAESFVRGVVARQVQARIASVACPREYESQVGTEFTCVVTGADGSTGDAEVTQQKRSVLSVKAPFLHVREVEAFMTRQIERESKLDGVMFACPEIVVVRTGTLFQCKATAAGASRNVNVRLTDEDGHFRYRPPSFG